MLKLSTYINVAEWPISRATLSACSVSASAACGIAEQPKGQRPPAQGCRADVLAKTRRQRTMLGSVVERERAIEMRARICDIAGMQQGQAHQAMADHERPRRALLIGEGEELDRKLTHHVAVECYEVRDPEAVKDGEQQQGIFGRLAERFRLLDQQARPLHRSPGFRRRIAADVEEGGYECNLKLDLLAPQGGRARQGRDQVERAPELLCGFNQRRALPADRCPALPQRAAAFSICPASA